MCAVTIWQADVVPQDTLAGAAGISQTFLSQVETGRNNISVDKLEQIADALGMDIIDLLQPLPV
jgi:transcriptional regulator with XRE-family HTH domain